MDSTTTQHDGVLEKSAEIKELATAFVKAQGEMTSAKKSGYNPHFQSSFPTLQDVKDATDEALQKNGLAITQLGGGKSLITLLMHISGQWVLSRFDLRPSKDDPQGWGSAITYFRRFAWQGITGIAAEDDDGNTASKGTLAQMTSSPSTINPPAAYGITDGQVKRIFAIAYGNNWKTPQIVGLIQERLQCAVEEIKYMDYDKVVKYFQETKAPAA